MDIDAIRKINWSNYDHAYRAANDVCGLLCSLVGPLGEQKNSIDSLLSNIFHQGTIYSATIPAIEFLFQAIEDEKCLVVSDIIYLIAAIATGYSHNEEITANVKAAILSKGYRLERFLDSDDIEIRMNTAYAMGLMIKDPFGEFLCRRYWKETDSSVLASIVFSIAALHFEKQDLIRNAIGYYDRTVKISAAIAVIEFGIADLMKDGGLIISAALIDPPNDESFRKLPIRGPYNEEDLFADALCKIGWMHNESRYLCDFLVNNLGNADKYILPAIIQAILGLSFPKSSEVKIVNDYQKFVIQTIINLNEIWPDYQSCWYLPRFELFGLPDKNELFIKLIEK